MTGGVPMDKLAGGGDYILGPVLEGAPVSLEDGRVIGHVEDGKVRITDEAVLANLGGGVPLAVSIGPVQPREEEWSLIYPPEPPC